MQLIARRFDTILDFDRQGNSWLGHATPHRLVLGESTRPKAKGIPVALGWSRRGSPSTKSGCTLLRLIRGTIAEGVPVALGWSDRHGPLAEIGRTPLSP